MRNERGFALLSVMLVLALLAVVVTEFSTSARLESSMIRSYRDGVLATHLAEGAVQQALREILGPGTVVALDDDGSLSFYRAPDAGNVSSGNVSTKVARLPRQRVPLGAGEFSYRISDEEARVNVNTAGPDRIERLLSAAGLDKQTRDTINDSLQDWKDADDLRRINGAESEDYLKQPVPYRARNGALQDAAELLQIRGVTRDIYRGVQDHAGLADLVTAVGRDTVNMNTAPAPVLTSLGFSDAEVAEITSTRVRTPYTAVPPRFTGKGLGVGSVTFRIEAEGRIGGEPRARIVAIIQRQAQLSSAGATGVKAAVLSWRPSEP
jgi:general secretion pathway protein K